MLTLEGLKSPAIRFLFLLLVSILLFSMAVPIVAQDDAPVINKVNLDISCFDADGNEVNSGLGTLTEGGSPTILLKDEATTQECARLAVQLLLSQIDDQVIAQMFGGTSSTTADPVPEETPAPPDEEANTIELGTPADPVINFARECDNREATTNGVRITAELPSGSYRVILLPVRFQTFDPILFVDSGSERVCSSESSLAREYVVDFSRADIGSQVYGNASGGAIEFDVEGNATQLSPIEIIVGGQDRSDRGASGDFILILEGARLSPQANTHVYSVTMTNSLFESDSPFGVVVLGVDDILDPSLSAVAQLSANEAVALYECEDAGGSCDSDARRTLEGTSVVEAAVRTVQGDDRDAAILKLPGSYLALGVQEVSYYVTELQDDTTSREEYVIVFYGGID